MNKQQQGDAASLALAQSALDKMRGGNGNNQTNQPVVNQAVPMATNGTGAQGVAA